MAIARYRQADAEFSGLEAEIDLPPLSSRWGTVSGRLLADYVRARLKHGGDLPQIPPLRFGAEIGLERDQVAGSLTVMHYDTQDRTGPNELPTAGYTMLDLNLSYRLSSGPRRTLLFLRGANLLDEEARRHTSPLKDLAPLPGRSIGAGVRVEF